jgi:hypothetical protein
MAAAYLKEIYEDKIVDVLLEEIELHPSGTDWMVTVSFRRKGYVQGDDFFVGMMKRDDERRYKRLVIDKETGEIKSMKIRDA